MKFTIQYYEEEHEWIAVCKEEPAVQVRAQSEAEATKRMREALEEHLAGLIAEYARARENNDPRADELEGKMRALDMTVSFTLGGAED
ncbi:MAG: hypothetical protein ACOCVM_05450 [Desulfovibrionaceae bacterium]